MVRVLLYPNGSSTIPDDKVPLEVDPQWSPDNLREAIARQMLCPFKDKIGIYLEDGVELKYVSQLKDANQKIFVAKNGEAFRRYRLKALEESTLVAVRPHKNQPQWCSVSDGGLTITCRHPDLKQIEENPAVCENVVCKNVSQRGFETQSGKYYWEVEVSHQCFGKFPSFIDYAAVQIGVDGIHQEPIYPQFTLFKRKQHNFPTPIDVWYEGREYPDRPSKALKMLKFGCLPTPPHMDFDFKQRAYKKMVSEWGYNNSTRTIGVILDTDSYEISFYEEHNLIQKLPFPCLEDAILRPSVAMLRVPSDAGAETTCKLRFVSWQPNDKSNKTLQQKKKIIKYFKRIAPREEKKLRKAEIRAEKKKLRREQKERKKEKRKIARGVAVDVDALTRGVKSKLDINENIED